MVRSSEQFAAAPVVDSETSCSERDAIVGDARAPSASNSRRLIRGLGGLSALLALCSVAAFAGHQSLAEEPAAVSRSAAPENRKHRTGCTNWDKILIKKVTDSNATRCHDICHATAGCHSYNVQESDAAHCVDTHLGLKKGTCYIYGDGCDEITNHCWDLYYERPPTAGWKLLKHRTGCADWATQLVGKSIVKDEVQCGAACSANPSCKLFNYQPATCDGKQQLEEGACYLFKGCTQLANKCWDLYQYVASPVTYTETTVETTKATEAAVLEASRKSWVSYLAVGDGTVRASLAAKSGPDSAGKYTYKVKIQYKKTGWPSRRLQDDQVTDKINKAASGDATAISELTAGIDKNGGETVSSLSTTSAATELVDDTEVATTTAAPQTTSTN